MAFVKRLFTTHMVLSLYTNGFQLFVSILAFTQTTRTWTIVSSLLRALTAGTWLFTSGLLVLMPVVHSVRGQSSCFYLSEVLRNRYWSEFLFSLYKSKALSGAEFWLFLLRVYLFERTKYLLRST